MHDNEIIKNIKSPIIIPMTLKPSFHYKWHMQLMTLFIVSLEHWQKIFKRLRKYLEAGAAKIFNCLGAGVGAYTVWWIWSHWRWPGPLCSLPPSHSLSSLSSRLELGPVLCSSSTVATVGPCATPTNGARHNNRNQGSGWLEWEVLGEEPIFQLKNRRFSF